MAGAKPQFRGHRQPLVPHPSIGFYSAGDPEVIRAQADLAKRHGVHAFCILTRLLGTAGARHPLEVVSANQDIDLTFCACIGGEERPEQPLHPSKRSHEQSAHAGPAVDISAIAKYLGDARYLRIDCRPLVVVARPDLLGDAAATVEGWRRWARGHGVGEIYLAYLRPEEASDFKGDGFDAEIDLPLGGAGGLDVAPGHPGVSASFRGRICDWRQLVEDAESPTAEGDFKRFPGVNVGWDDTPQAGGSATIYAGATPDLLQLWVDRAISRASVHKNQSERLVFLNAWNDWLNGAVVEPEATAGHARLEAVRTAVLRQGLSVRLAVAIHAFYPDVLPEILRRVRFMPPETKLFVSCRAEHVDVVREQLESTGRHFAIYPVANRGRDVAPFLEMLADIEIQGYPLVAKVHTKKSPHFEHGEQWRAQLFEAVLGLGSFNRSLRAFMDDPTLGMVGPTQHFLPMSTFMEANAEQIFVHSAKLGYGAEEVSKLGFFAGTMFIARVAAIRRMLDLGITLESFDPEMGQTDGTLAHALERVLSVCVIASGFRHGGHWNPAAEVRLSRNHQFL